MLIFIKKKKLYRIIVSYYVLQVYNNGITRFFFSFFFVMFSAVGRLCITTVADVSFCFWVLLGMYK